MQKDFKPAVHSLDSFSQFPDISKTTSYNLYNNETLSHHINPSSPRIRNNPTTDHCHAIGFL
jgi:hypothetical protein